jgi:hypothetical protein
MLNFDDLDLLKLKIKNDEIERNKKFDYEKIKFYNSLYNKNDLSSYILVNKKPRKSSQFKKQLKERDNFNN